jgi:hypothetical protein
LKRANRRDAQVVNAEAKAATEPARLGVMHVIIMQGDVAQYPVHC